MMSLPEIIHEVMKYPTAPMVILTGGEPSLFVDEEIVKALKMTTGKTIAIETNGTLPLPGNIDWVTLSPKTAFQGGKALPCAVFAGLFAPDKNTCGRVDAQQRDIPFTPDEQR